MDATTTTTDTSPSTDPAPESSLVDAMFDVATAWAAVGIGKAKLALEKSSDSLARAATRLAKLELELKT